jgi:hypothetical protein
VNDYILKIAVIVVENGLEVDRLELFKWARFPHCPQVGWTVCVIGHDLAVRDVMISDGMWSPIISVESWKTDYGVQSDHDIDILKNSGYLDVEGFDFSMPPR